MKQSAAKTLGVAALGAAFAAVGAGAANAAPALPDTSGALDTVTRTLPTENVSKALPGAGEAVAPVAGLLGGLPVGQTGLPTHGLAMNGLPLG
ncbi:ATP-binding protein [Streptomyces gilvus]|uniref:ATP-binding protein n=1 Tax=Streptomyces gilvus TaxID=2920937 RepID=UPI001F0FF458|nr:ATP-binding protein [Streptomyces sp. CME 23]MCH5677538.1 ATP-binding protein [Streptomyces sp. CME 23]